MGFLILSFLLSPTIGVFTFKMFHMVCTNSRNTTVSIHSGLLME
uniref:Uncharacterized protein n=1 Tax=Lepeophtheirus salmonis TaxID=72036 RepID=A0A0K2U0L2_LEPSM